MKTKNLILNCCIALWASACSPGGDPTQSAGVIITENQVSGKIMDTTATTVYLFNSTNPLVAIKTLKLPHGGEFKFDSLNPGVYTVQSVLDNGLKGAIRSQVTIPEVDSSLIRASKDTVIQNHVVLGNVQNNNFVSIPIRPNDPTAKVYAYGKEIPLVNGVAQIPFLPLDGINPVLILQNGSATSIDLNLVANQLRSKGNLGVIQAQDLNTIYDIGQKLTYHTLRVGDREWLLEPVSFVSSGTDGICFNKTQICPGEGLFYQGLNTILIAGAGTYTQICPSGYQIPSKSDLDELVSSIGSYANAGFLLRSKNWQGKPGSDPFGFNWQASGWFNSTGTPEGQGQLGAFWLAERDDKTGNMLVAYQDSSTDSLSIRQLPSQKARAQVRCVKNNSTPMAP